MPPTDFGLELGINVDNLSDLPPTSVLGGMSLLDRYRAARSAGFTMVQGGDDDLAQHAGLRRTGLARVDSVPDIDRIAASAQARGHDSVTLHVGTGFESDATIDTLVEAILVAAQEHRTPLLIETHRATITQDPWRTLRMIDRHPSVRLTGDFSHWYTGVELVYGDLDAKLDALQPVFERVRLIHGRIGTPGSIQVDIDGRESESFVGHFVAMWGRVFASFFERAEPGETIAFVPELLGPANHYARLVRGPTGELVEEGDRWLQALALSRLAADAFVDARDRLSPRPL